MSKKGVAEERRATDGRGTKERTKKRRWWKREDRGGERAEE